MYFTLRIMHGCFLLHGIINLWRGRTWHPFSVVWLRREYTTHRLVETLLVFTLYTRNGWPTSTGSVKVAALFYPLHLEYPDSMYIIYCISVSFLHWSPRQTWKWSLRERLLLTFRLNSILKSFHFKTSSVDVSSTRVPLLLHPLLQLSFSSEETQHIQNSFLVLLLFPQPPCKWSCKCMNSAC